MVQIQTVEQERKFVDYSNTRNEVRAMMAQVYVDCRNTLAGYASLTARLADENDLAEFTDYHTDSTAPVQPYIDTLQTEMGSIVAIMEGIETAAPNTFGISLPQ